MEEETVTDSAAIGLQHAKALRELALAAFYPSTHSDDAAHLRRIKNASPASAVPPMGRRLPPNPTPEESVAKPRKKPRRIYAVTPYPGGPNPPLFR
jgi:hypothetical protein